MSIARIVSVAAAALLLAGGALAQSAKVTGGSRQSVREAQRDVVAGKKPRVAVRQFENRSGVRFFYDGKHVGEGMKEMLESALMETGKFLVFERESLDDVLLEQDYGQSPRFRQGGAPRMGELETLDFLVTGAVTELLQDQSSAGGRVKAGRKKRKKKKGIDLFDLAGGFKKDHVAIDVKLIDVRTGQIVATTSVEGEAGDLSLDGALGALGDTGRLLLAAGGESRTPIQKAVRACIVQAVDWIAKRIEAEGFYRADESPWSEPTRVEPKPQPPPRVEPRPENTARSVPPPAPSRVVDVPIATVVAEPRADAEVLALVGSGGALTQAASKSRIGEFLPVVLADGRHGWVDRSAIRD